MDDSLGVAVIGYAFMGKAHSNAWRNVGAFHTGVPAVRQEVLVGRDPAQVAAAASRYGWARSATDWRAVIEDDSVDIVDICVPGHLHAEIAIAALAAGKHVLVEKPLANTIPEAEAMVLAAAEAARRGVWAMVGFNYRRVPALAMARDLIAAGRLGTVRQVRVSYLQDWLVDDSAPMTWRMRKEAAGSGALGDLGSHAVDQVRYLLGADIASVNGQLETFVAERAGADGLEAVTVDDAAWATLRTTSGVVASIEVSRMATGRKNALAIDVYGSTGALRFSLESLNELHVCLGDSPRLHPDPRHRGPPPLRRRVVAAGPHPRLGPHVHQPGRRPPRLRSPPGRSRPRASPTASPYNACWPPSRTVRHARGHRISLEEHS